MKAPNNFPTNPAAERSSRPVVIATSFTAFLVVAAVGCNNGGSDPATMPGPSTAAPTGGTPASSGTMGSTQATAGASGSTPMPAASGGSPGMTVGASASGASASSGVSGASGTGAGTASGVAGTTGSGGSAGMSMAAAGTGGTSDKPLLANGFVNLAPPMGEPLDPMAAKTLTPPPPQGWVYHEFAGTTCRDGSPAGLFLHAGTEPKLLMFLEGGGACSNGPLCGFNPTNVNESFAGDGTTLIGSALAVVADRQQPGGYTDASHQGAPAGIFEFDNPMNPFKGWNQIYIPYCTGDVHAGTKPHGDVPGLTDQNFTGHLNMKAFMSRIVPTFAGKIDHVVISGSSAGSLGAFMNYPMVQDSFGDVHVDLIADAGFPFRDMYWPICLQKRWRDTWGLNATIPPDCPGCFREDGGGLAENMTPFYFKKYPKFRVAAISRTEDEIIRLFYSAGLNNCANYDTLDPVETTIGAILDPSVLYSGEMYTAALKDFTSWSISIGGHVSTFLIGPPNETNLHQLIFRPEFYTLKVGDKTAAQFIADFLAGTDQQLRN